MCQPYASHRVGIDHKLWPREARGFPVEAESPRAKEQGTLASKATSAVSGHPLSFAGLRWAVYGRGPWTSLLRLWGAGGEQL